MYTYSIKFIHFLKNDIDALRAVFVPIGHLREECLLADHFMPSLSDLNIYT
jgi:hypothetical protein